MRNPQFTLTTESLTVHLDGECFTIKNGDANFEAARTATLNSEWEKVRKLVSKGLSLFVWLKDFPDWSYGDNAIRYRNETLPPELNQRMLALESSGSSPTNLAKFWERLQLNPSWRSVQQTYSFLQHADISIDDEGFILAYKGVNSDWFDCHTGKTHKNTPGAVICEPRNKISDDPSQACHYGLHAGDITYARGFAKGRVVIVRIDPQHVVSIPRDESCRKLRCCEYTVVGVHNENQKPMPMNTTIDEDEVIQNVAKPPKTENSEATPTAWESFNDLTDEELGSQNMADLRKYASNVLHIVGASKLRKFEKNDKDVECGLVAVCILERAKNRAS